MARTDRLLRLMQALRSLPAPVTAERLAEETEVSPRSLYRDIASLRAAGAQIEGTPGFGYVLTEDIALPPMRFAQMEIEAISAGLSIVEAGGDPDLRRAAREALSKLRASLPEREQSQILHAVTRVYRAQPPEAAVRDLSKIREASWKERAIEIDYSDKDGSATTRRIWPLAIVWMEQSFVVLAWCCLRQDFRMFRPDRISATRPTDESFRPRRAPLLRDYVARLRRGRAPLDRNAPPA